MGSLLLNTTLFLSANEITLQDLKHQCEKLKPGTEYVIQMTQKQLDEQFKKVIENTGCEIKIENKNGKPIVKIVKKEESAKIVNDIKSYEDACLNSVAGEKVTILVSKEFYRKHGKEILKSIPEEDTCEIK